MKILALADLHIQAKYLAESFYHKKQKRLFEMQFENLLNDVDLVIIAGDVVESSIIKYQCNPLEQLYKLFDKDIIFCLGNHEFAFQSYPKVIEYWSQFKHEHIHCLDIEGSVKYNNINFVGNVLWYDFTLNECRQLMYGEIIDGWLDATIEDFKPLEECEKCKQQIANNLSKEHKNILLTHMVPHKLLNRFSLEQPTSPYNAYSGCNRFLNECLESGFNIDYAICGHTHKKECVEIFDTKCINIGNDYFHRSNQIKYFIIEMDN